MSVLVEDVQVFNRGDAMLLKNITEDTNRDMLRFASLVALDRGEDE